MRMSSRVALFLLPLVIVAGTLAGAGMGYHLGQRRAGIFVWLASATVAVIFAALGSLDLGLVVSISLSAA